MFTSVLVVALVLFGLNTAPSHAKTGTTDVHPMQVIDPQPTAASAPSTTFAQLPQADVCNRTTVVITPKLAIPDNIATYTCVDLVAPNIGTVNTLTLQVGISHTFVSDLVLQLRSPDGKRLTLMNRVSRPALLLGSPANLSSTFPITFAATGIDAEKMGLTLTNTESIVCRDDKQCTYAANPDTDGGSTISSTTGFTGSPSVGTWKLCFQDVVGGDVGQLDSASLDLICRATSQTLVNLPVIVR